MKHDLVCNPQYQMSIPTEGIIPLGSRNARVHGFYFSRGAERMVDDGIKRLKDVDCHNSYYEIKWF